MIVYRRFGTPTGDVIEPFWRNTITGDLEQLTWEVLKRDGHITPANQINNGERYTRMNWPPYFTQPVNRYRNPRNLYPDGTVIV